MTRLEQFDLTPFNRATIGFEKIFNDFDRHFSNSTTSYPPYNIIKNDENEWVVSLAVAGFDMENLEITQDKNVLTIEGKPSDEPDDKNYLHKGIGMRAFRRQFTLADYVEVKDASIDLGILSVNLVRNIPDEMLPRKIEILSKTK
jgi:molecular chaperone IbpA